jgi:hypothetical protein
MRQIHLRLLRCSEDAIELPEDFPLRELPEELVKALDGIWQAPEQLFEAAWVCSLLDLEVWTELYFRSPEQISAAIRLISRARGRYDERHARATPFQTPSHLGVRLWRLVHERSEVVSNARASLFDLLDCHDLDSLLDALGKSRLWWDARNAAQRALARSIQIIDPSIKRWTSDTQIAPIVEGVLRLRRYDLDLRYGLCEMDELLRDERSPG